MDAIVIDEFAFFDEAVIRSQIFPLFRMPWVPMFGSSSQTENSDSMFYRLFKEKVVPLTDIKMVCEKCYNKGLRKACRHKAYQQPTWVDNDREELIRKMTGAENSTDFDREMLGIFSEKEGKYYVFNDKDIAYAFEKAQFPLASIMLQVRYVIVSIDPCSGTVDKESKNSRYSMCAMVFPYVIVSLEDLDVQELCPEDVHMCAEKADEIIVNNLQEIARRNGMFRVQFRIGVENNNGMEWSRVPGYIRKHSGLNVHIENSFKYKTGLIMDPEKKREMAVEMQRVLWERNPGLSFSDEMVCVTEEARIVKQRLRSQLENYQVIMTESNGPNKRVRTSIGGKHGKNRDDLAISAQWCVYLCNRLGPVLY